MPSATTPASRWSGRGSNLGFSAGNNAGARICDRRLRRVPQRRHQRWPPTGSRSSSRWPTSGRRPRRRVDARLERCTRRLRRGAGELRGPWLLPALRRAASKRVDTGRAADPLRRAAAPCCSPRRLRVRAAGGTSRRSPTTRMWSSAGDCGSSATRSGWPLARWSTTSTTGRPRPASRRGSRAFERNGLRMIYALLEDDTLQRVLPAALLLAAIARCWQHPSAGRRRRGYRTASAALPPSPRPSGPLRHALIQRGARREPRRRREPAEAGHWRPGRRRPRHRARHEGRAGTDAARDRAILIERAGLARSLDGRRSACQPRRRGPARHPGLPATCCRS